MTDTLDDIWQDDLLDRRSDAEFLIEFLTRRTDERGVAGKTKSYVLNIDAEWGFGKTFFLERLARHLKAENYLCAHINAWKDDVL